MLQVKSHSCEVKSGSLILIKLTQLGSLLPQAGSHFLMAVTCRSINVDITHQSLLLTASPKPGVSTTVSRSWTPPSFSTTWFVSTWQPQLHASTTHIHCISHHAIGSSTWMISVVPCRPKLLPNLKCTESRSHPAVDYCHRGCLKYSTSRKVSGVLHLGNF